MITPIGQRQILQTAAAEAVRAAQEGGEHVQREIARRQILDQQLAQDQGAVHQVTSSENLRLEEDARERKRREQEAREGRSGESADGPEDSPAAPAESHLDFLA